MTASEPENQSCDDRSAFLDEVLGRSGWRELVVMMRQVVPARGEHFFLFNIFFA